MKHTEAEVQESIDAVMSITMHLAKIIPDSDFRDITVLIGLLTIATVIWTIAASSEESSPEQSDA